MCREVTEVENRCSGPPAMSSFQSATMAHAVSFHCWFGDTVGTRRANLMDFLAGGLSGHNGTDTGNSPTGRTPGLGAEACGPGG